MTGEKAHPRAHTTMEQADWSRHRNEPVHLLGEVELKDLPGTWELFGVGEQSGHALPARIGRS